MSDTDRFMEIEAALEEALGAGEGERWADGLTSLNKLVEALEICFGVTDEELLPGLPVDDPSKVVVKAKGDRPAKTGHDIMNDIQAPYEYLGRIIHEYIHMRIEKHDEKRSAHKD